MTEVERDLAADGQRVKELEDMVADLRKQLAQSREEVKNLQKAKTNCELDIVNLKEELETVKQERDEMAAKAKTAEEKLAEEDNQKENSKRDVSDTDKHLVEDILMRANANELEMGKIMELMSNADALSPEDKQKMEDLRSKVEHLEQQLELSKENEVICEAQTKEAQANCEKIRSKVLAADDLNVLKRNIYKQDDDSDTEEEQKKNAKRLERRNSTVNNSFVNLGERIDTLAKDLDLSEEKERITSLIELFKKLGKPSTPLVVPKSNDTPKEAKVLTEPERVTEPEKVTEREKSAEPVRSTAPEMKEEASSLLELSEQIEELSPRKQKGETASEPRESEDSIFKGGLMAPNNTKRVRFSQMDEDFQILEEENEEIYANKASSEDGSENAADKDADGMFGPIEDL